MALALATSVHFSHTNSKRQTENAINDDVVVVASAAAATDAFVVLEIFVTLWQTLRAKLRTQHSPHRHRHPTLALLRPKQQKRTRGLARSRSAWVRLSLVKRSLRLKAKTENRNEIAVNSRNPSWLGERQLERESAPRVTLSRREGERTP